jgi:putative oxidoreductase
MSFYATLSESMPALALLSECLLRIYVGLALVPHGLRAIFGLFTAEGNPPNNIRRFAASLDRGGWRPGTLWAWLIGFVQLVCGPLLALGLFTRLVALPIFIFLAVANIERWRVGKYFWNTRGLEYTVMWTLAAFYFLTHGGGEWSLDAIFDLDR